MEEWWKDFLRFRKFITPAVMPVVFWIGVAIVIIMGIIGLVIGGREGDARSIVVGIFTLFAGPLFVRVLCEWVMTFFQEK